MGNVTFSIPYGLVLALKKASGIETFVETGTYKARTSSWAAGHFDRVITIELSKQLHAAAKARYAHMRNIDFRQGDTREVLKQVAVELKNPAIFWLDAHWCDGVTAGVDHECPILEEIDILDASGVEHVLLIDDAHMHLSPAPQPHDMEKWPDLWTVYRALTAKYPDRYIVIFLDVIIVVPRSLRPALREFCHVHKHYSSLVRRVLGSAKRKLRTLSG